MQHSRQNEMVFTKMLKIFTQLNIWMQFYAVVKYRQKLSIIST